MIIFGQQDYAERLQRYYEKISPKIRATVFSLSMQEENPSQYFFDFSFYDNEFSKFDKNTKINVAFGVQYREEAIKHLKRLGFKNLQIYDAAMDNDLKKEFFKKTFSEQGKSISFIDEKKSVAVYMAKSVEDKSSPDYTKNLSKHIIPIQVGAALTDIKIADVRDDFGDNISERNRHYSETTALYWIWKNAEADYLGLCHYRRLWENLDFVVGFLQNDEIDVVLPVPTLCVHSVLEDYMKRYIPEVYPIMLETLKEKSPDYFEASKEIYAGQIFYACNMLIAKREALNKLCEWMFPIVFEIEKRVGDLADPYKNRYAGFCTERLITLYFLRNKEKYRIAHSGKIFIE